MKFSLVIPVAPERNAEILESIKELDYPKKEFHVVVVKGKNPSENRNKGAKKSTGEIIGFLDDDANLDKNFLKNVENFFNEYPLVDVVGGPQLTPNDDTGFAKISGYALCSRFGAAEACNRYRKGDLNLNADEDSITSANLFVRKQVMDKISFDTNLFPGEDPKFIEDVKEAGFRVAYSPDFVVYHRRRPTVKGLIKQIFNYGKVRPKKESFFRTLKRPFFLIPSLFVIYLAVLIISSLFNPVITGGVIGVDRPILNFLFIPLALYIVLAIIFSFIDSVNNKDFKSLLVLPFIYLLIHLSYGIGMIWGYMRK